MRYRHLPVIVEAVTFDELAEHGRQQGVPCYGPLGLPWSFTYQGQPVTHENDDCYLVSGPGAPIRLRRGEMLITGAKGELYSCSGGETFASLYDPSPGLPDPVAPSDPVAQPQRDPEDVLADIAQIAFTEAGNPAVALVRIRQLLFPGYVEGDFVDDLTREIARLKGLCGDV